MRKIIFRGKNPVGNWEYGLVHISGGQAFITGINGGLCADVDHETVGQYTGVFAKDGKYIYEGDIIRAVLPATEVCREFVWPLMAVAFHDGAFGVWQSQREFTPLRSFASRVEFTVVGNIHDNPDMLEVQHG